MGRDEHRIPCHVNVSCPKCGDGTKEFDNLIAGEMWEQSQRNYHAQCSPESWVVLTTDEEWR